MTTAQVKTYLGIPTATTTYDADIARLLPIVEATVNQITSGLYILQDQRNNHGGIERLCR